MPAPMPVKTLAIATACTLTLLIAGCSGKVRYPSYHTLSIAPSLKSDASITPRPVSVAVRRFETPAYLRQGGVVYSEAPGEIGVFEYPRGAVSPGAKVTTAGVDPRRSS